MKNVIINLLFCLSFVPVFSQELAVTFPSENWTLNGTLALPSGSGPFSVVILVHGSGPNDRDQTLEISGGNAQCLYPDLMGDTIRNFKGISDSLVNHGVAVFRYDKRTFTHGAQLNPLTVSPYDFVTDINSAVDYLKTRAEVDTNCISLLGHSQGASLVPLVASQRNDIKSVICLGTPASRVDTLLANQFRDLYVICLNDPVTGNDFYTQTLSDFASIRNGSWNPITPYLGGYPLFWNDWMDIGENSIADFNSLNVPFIILHGEDDFNVPLSDYQRLSSEVNNSNASFMLLTGINHYMTNSSNPKVSGSVISEIMGFLNTHSCDPVSVRSDIQKEDIQWVQQQGIIRITSSSNISMVDIYELNGQLIQQQSASTQSVEVSTERISSGIYLLKIVGITQTQVFKVFIP